MAPAALNAVPEADADGLSAESEPPLAGDAVATEQKESPLAANAVTADEQEPPSATDEAAIEQKEPTTEETEPRLAAPGQEAGEAKSAAASHGQLESHTEETTAATALPATAANEACKDGKPLENQGSPHSGPGEAAIPGTADGNDAVGEQSAEDVASGQSRCASPLIRYLEYGGIIWHMAMHYA